MRRLTYLLLAMTAALSLYGAQTRVCQVPNDTLFDGAFDPAPPLTSHPGFQFHNPLVEPLEAQTGGDFRGYQKTFPAQTVVGATASSGLMRGIAINHTAELIVTGGPATCTYRLQGTKDAVTWFNISAADLTCTSSTVGFEANKPVVQIRGNLLTLTGGTSPTITLKYVGR